MDGRIIAGLLSECRNLVAHPARQRMKPVETLKQPAEEGKERISAVEMSHFVSQDRMQLLVTPGNPMDWKENPGPQKTSHERNLNSARDVKTGRFHVGSNGEFLDELSRIGGFDWFTVPQEPSASPRTHPKRASADTHPASRRAPARRAERRAIRLEKSRRQ